MHITEYGAEHARTLLFLPCTAEPVWAFSATVALLARRWHVFQVSYDGHEPAYPGDFLSVEQTVAEIMLWLRSRGITWLDAAYGCSLGGACLTRLLALGELPVGRAIIDGGITPYQLPFPVRRLLLARDCIGFRLVTRSRGILEAAFPPERFTRRGTTRKRSTTRCRRISGLTPAGRFATRSGRETTMPCPARPRRRGRKSPIGTATMRRKTAAATSGSSSAIFRTSGVRGIPKMAHAELVMIHPEEFCHYADKFLLSGAGESRGEV